MEIRQHIEELENEMIAARKLPMFQKAMRAERIADKTLELLKSLVNDVEKLKGERNE